MATYGLIISNVHTVQEDLDIKQTQSEEQKDFISCAHNCSHVL